MKIAQIVPIWETVPPPKYGGTQRVVYNLTEGLVRASHDVTLFATGDSSTSAKLISIYPRALYRDNVSWENHLYSTLNIYEAFEKADDFDIIHCHIDRHTEYSALAMAKFIKKPIIFTLHFELPHTPEKEDRKKFLETFKDLNYVSISNSQREYLPTLNFVATVYNGIEVEKIQFAESAGDNLLWLGRFNPYKGAKEAIEIAKQTDFSLVMAGKLDQLDKEDVAYFEKEIKPNIDDDRIKYIGEIDETEKAKFLLGGRALLNPIQWREPFGLVPVEAMAAGVPVIANSLGAMPEIIEDGETGFLVNSAQEAIEALKKIDQIDRNYCRKFVEENFSVSKMVSSYIEVYKRIINE